MVLIWHYLVCQLHWKIGILLAFANITWSGVDLFFVLSGFLIVGILLDNKQAKNYFQVFYLRRISRIFPLYYLIFFTFLGLIILAPKNLGWLYQAPLPLWSYLLFVQNFVMGIKNTWGPNWIALTWSLAIEEQFYLVIPFLIRFFKPIFVISLFIVLIIFAPILRYILADLGSYVLPFARADAILLGGLLAFAVRNKQFLSVLKKYKQLHLILFLIFLVGAGIISYRFSIIGSVFNHSWLAIFYGLFLLFPIINRESPITQGLNNQFLIWFGLRSYAIYLFHQPVSGILHGVLNQANPQINGFYSGFVTVLALILTCFLAELSYKFFEAPILKFAHQYKYVKIEKYV